MLVEESQGIKDVGVLLNSLLRKYDIKIGENAIMIYIGCSDDQCTTVLEYLKRNISPKTSEHDIVKGDEIYERRVFGGIFVPNHHTVESLMPAVHHIPPSHIKKLCILHLSHIGYDKTKGYGWFVRYGHKHPTTSCGAIKMLYEDDATPQDIDLVCLKEFIHETKSRKKTDSIEMLTYYLLEASSHYVKEEISNIAKKEDIEVLYLSGIEIDMSKVPGEIYNDRIYVHEISYHTPEHSISLKEGAA